MKTTQPPLNNLQLELLKIYAQGIKRTPRRGDAIVSTENRLHIKNPFQSVS